MAIPISGILLDPYGNVARFADIKLVTVQGSLDVIESSSAVFRTDENGAYAMTVQFGRFAVLMRFNGNNGAYEKIQVITVNSDTVASTLGELLAYTEPLTPAEILLVQQLVAQAIAAKDDAEAAALAALISEQNAAASAAAALASEIAAANSVALLAPVPLNGGVWAAGQTFTAYNQYMIYNGEAYSPRQETVLPYVVGAVPDLNFVYQIKLNSLQALSGLTEPSDLDKSYRRVTTVAAVEAGDYKAGDKLTLSDRAGANFDVIAGGTPNGFDILDAGDGNTASSVDYIGVGDSTLLVSNFELSNSQKIKGVGPQTSKISPAAINTNILDFNSGQADTLIDGVWFEGLGYPSDTTENGIVFDGSQNCRRNRIENSRFNGLSGSALKYSAGWGNRLQNVNINSCLKGIEFKVSPLLAGWSGSGFLMDSSYVATCDTGIEMQAIWNFTSLNSVIEDCNLPINQTQSATPAVWINTWFESNAQSPRLTQSNIFIGGRLEGGEAPVTPFYGNMALPAAPFDNECITEITYGISIFRDFDDQVFKADGQGVKFFKPHSSLGWDVLNVAGQTAKKISVARGTNGIGGGITSNTWANDAGSWVDITKLVGRRHFNSFDVDLMDEWGFKVQGQGASSSGGIGFTRCVMSSGRYVSGGGGSTEGGERWEVDEDGHFAPLVDNRFDIGATASFRVRDMRIVNAPIVGSDVRIKDDIKSIPQELLDFALSVEVKQYKLKERNRTHYGIVITPELLDSLSKVVNLDDCAAFCRDIFTDGNGKPITNIIGGVELGDLWQVRYDEWQNILLEAMRRKILAM